MVVVTCSDWSLLAQQVLGKSTAYNLELSTGKLPQGLLSLM